MKKYLLLLSAFLCTNCHAEGGRLISEFIDHVDKIPDVHVQTKNATCTASANYVQATAGDMVKATGSISYTLYNPSNTVQTYKIDKYMCINGFGCTHEQDTLQLDCGGSVNDNDDLYTEDYIENPGQYVDQASVQISGDSSCVVNGYNTVSVN